jgi:hypothetical protein
MEIENEEYLLGVIQRMIEEANATVIFEDLEKIAGVRFELVQYSLTIH